MKKQHPVINRIWGLVQEFRVLLKGNSINTYAAGAAYFLFLSIVPMLILLCTIIPYTTLTQENLMSAVLDICPDMMEPLAVSLISEVYDKSMGLLSVAALTTLWSAGKGVLALTRGLNGVNQVEDHRNFFVVRLMSIFYTVIMLVILILSLFGMVFGDQIVELLLHRFPKTQGIVSFLMNFRFLAVWAVLTMLFAAVYAYVPDKKLKLKEQLPGATFSAVGWSIFSWGFSLYASRSESYTMYGSLSLIVIVMFWLYICVYILLLGAYVNQWYLMRNEEV